MGPYWVSDCGRAVVYVGDCREVLVKQIRPHQFCAVVTDPPYGLEFMGKEWDKLGATTERVMDTAWNGKAPGESTSLPFGAGGGQRVRYGKSAKSMQGWYQECFEAIMRVTRPGAHLLSFGGTRTWHRMVCAIEDAGWEVRDCLMWAYGTGFPKSQDVSRAIDDHLGVVRERVRTKMSSDGNVWMDRIGAKRPWKEKAKEVGYHEHASREPVTVEAKQWDGWGSALKPAWEPICLARKPLSGTLAECVLEHGCGGLNVDGCKIGDRWPANLLHDGSEDVVLALGEVTRYFYTAKADDDDRPHGKGNGTTVHPTVKPLDLMRYLVRLVCPPGGVVLDPFMGSGSTGCAAVAEGMEFVGVEQDEEYADIAVGRLRLALAGVIQPVVVREDTPEDDRPPVQRVGK